ncbi:MAG: bifunctional precorrin-2 dehydrogenase/sirohydrochlorin ferrochelatase [Cytophagales bacterium]|nr:MAG: bifunctional precorrin-2 dehydrogenase/sirohydrochlorin ferrochelatase [Cytophagales bacterium]
MNTLFPIFVKFDKLKILIVGGGNVGLEKVEAIFNNCPEADVFLVAPFIKEEIITLSLKHPSLKLYQRNFNWDDLEQKNIVICTTDNKELHKKIYKKAREKLLLINVADTPDLCDFYLGSIVQKGDLKIAISTNGKSPTFAKRLREIFTETLPSDNINELLASLGAFRDKLKGDFQHKVKTLNELTKKMTE